MIALSSDHFKVKRVIDGDTFVLENDERIRLIGVDTPETVHPSKSVEYFGKEASAFTKKFLEGKSVRLEYGQQKKDKYGRILAYVFLDTLFVNAELIKQGYAHAYTKYPFKQEYMDLFRQLEKEARENKRGLWANDSTTTITPKDKYWLNTNSNTLHNSSCKWYGKTKEGYYSNEVLGNDCDICKGAHR